MFSYAKEENGPLTSGYLNVICLTVDNHVFTGAYESGAGNLCFWLGSRRNVRTRNNPKPLKCRMYLAESATQSFAFVTI